MLAGAISIYLDAEGYFQQVKWQWVALAAAIVFILSVFRHILALEGILWSKTTNIQMRKVHVTDGSTFAEMPLIIALAGEEKTLKRPTNFAHVEFANNRKHGTEQNHAIDVVALLTYYDIRGKILFDSVDGR